MESPNTNKIYYAYCVNPALNGQGDNGNYQMDLEGMLDANTVVDAGGTGGNGKSGENIKNWIWGAITYGFPNKSAAELGVKDDYAAYYATKMAIWSLIHNNYNDLNDWSAFTGANGGSYTQQERTDVLNAMKKIATQSKTFISGSQADVTATVTSVGAMQEIGGEFIQEYKVNVNWRNRRQILR